MNSVVGVEGGVSVTGIGVCVAGSVAVDEGKVTDGDVAMAGRQAEIRRRHPMRSFFIVLIKTQLPGALFQAMSIRTGV